MKRGKLGLLAIVLAVVGLIGGGSVLRGWYGAGPLAKPTAFIVPDGSTLGSLALKLQKDGAIRSALAFKLHARLLGGSADDIKAGEFELPAHASESQILALLAEGETLNRFVMIPEGMPSIMVYDRLMARPLLTGPVAVPKEGSVLPDSYAFARGEQRAAVVARMQAAMARVVKQAWAGRSPDTVAKTPEEAVVLASIVEKETAKPSERPMVAALYSNRLRKGMLLQADPTIIYPITRGKPLGRRIRQSEIQAVNDYNTYAMVGLPRGPITNPSKASIEAVLHPAKTTALYMVADGTGGHQFAETLEQHNANVAKWFALRRAKGEL
ncbi:endolytic transglycosylase MltG [Novosphingobium sp.]|uniref:endolytic transglycosylase MltG n=1 Tax=Novosphingobium sp. TaxID=1874826 RepID=UPI0025E9F892|nr:endolytic transglycosylase MltG [Novosphingobium sp.]